MKVNQLVWALLLVGVATIELPAQTLQSLCAFDGSNEGCQASLTLGNDGNFYGTTRNGGSYGTIFRVTTNGVLTTLVSFPFVTLGGIGVPLTLIDPNAASSPQRFYRISLSPQ